MNIWMSGSVAHECGRLLAQDGLVVRMVDDLAELQCILKAMEKSYLSPMFDPAFNSFTSANCFWLVAERDGVPQIAGAARLDDITGEDVYRYWDKMLGWTFGTVPEAPSVKLLPNELYGRVCYFGDLISLKGGVGLGSKGAMRLKLFTAIGHYLVQYHFKPDVTYCFLREKDMQRGGLHNYGFMDSMPFFYQWDEPPYPSGNPQWVGYIKKEKYPLLMHSVARFIGEEVRNKSQ